MKMTYINCLFFESMLDIPDNRIHRRPEKLLHCRTRRYEYGCAATTLTYPSRVKVPFTICSAGMFILLLPMTIEQSVEEEDTKLRLQRLAKSR